MINYVELKDSYSSSVILKKESVQYENPHMQKSSLSFKTLSLFAPLAATPIIASADTFSDIHSTVMSLFDGGVVLIIIFAGAAWALGHRSKAIELLIGVCCGYLLARHAIEIRDYLKSIGGA